LVVDDNPGDCVLVKHALESVGFDGAVVSVDRGRDAIAYLSGLPPYANLPMPHLIMLDLNMPAMSGFDVLREIKSRPEWASIPVDIFSSSTHPADMAKAGLLGARQYVVKPTDWEGYLLVAGEVRKTCCEAA
jgi:CheY-like chemotaxis protein